MVTKTRVIPGPIQTDRYNGAVTATKQLTGTAESIETFGHDYLHLGEGDKGGPLLLHSVADTWGLGSLSYPGGAYDHGTQYAVHSWVNSQPPVDSQPLQSEIHSMGTTAISRTIPTKAPADMATFLGETLSEGIPAMLGVTSLKERAQVARGSGGEYLNYEFGWAPLVRDVKSLCRAAKNSHQILSDLYKGSGKKTRVGYHFPSVSSHSQVSTDVFIQNAQGNLDYRVAGTLDVQTLSETWFKGAFTYLLPVSLNDMNAFQRWAFEADHVLGLRLSPEVLWNVAPWSWAADWFGNMGDVMTNLSYLGSDGLVLQYGYVMRHQRQMVQTVCQPFTHWSGITIGPCSKTSISEWKIRYPATPYGFGVDLHGLTPKQTAIVAALGLTKT